MKTIKFLCIAILGMVVWSAESLPTAASAVGNNVLDFDTIANARNNIPAIFQPKIYEPANYNAAGPNNLRYVYFTVFNPGEVEDGNFIHAVRRNPNQTEKNIFFPMDGHQPTTPEAVEYSCANIDNREDSPITEWYMKMFGVIPFQNVVNPAPHGYIKAGWDTVGGTQRIIQVLAPAAVGGAQALAAQRQRFENVFRVIAANRIGRLLLYRILIEIRRHDAAGNGACEHGIAPIPNRNFNRSVTVNWADSLSICFGHGAIPPHIPASNAIIRFNDKIIFTNGVFTRWSISGCHKVDRCCRPPEIGLFHEMVHWFHMLRAPNRSIQESKAYMIARGGAIIAPVNLLGSGRQETIGSYFWGNLKNNTRNSIKVSAIPWVEDKEINNVSKQQAKVINFEDIRTILGAPNLAKFRTVVPQPQHRNQFQYLEGDDLSENSFRVSLGMPIRLGHTTMDFYEDYQVVDRALEIAEGNAQNNLLNDQKGLGNLYIRNYNSYVLDRFFAN